MVVVFSQLPPHIQTNIAKRIELFDFINFQLSSACGRNFGLFVRPWCVINTILIEEDFKVLIRIFKPDNQIIHRNWDNIKHYGKNLPRFIVGEIEIKGNQTVERFSEFEKEINLIKGRPGAYLWWSMDMQDQFELFQKLTEMFHIGLLWVNNEGGEIDQAIVRTPEFLELGVISAKAIEPDDIFLRMKASDISSISLESKENGSTLNAFLHQWIRKERNLSRLYIDIHQDDQTLTPEIILLGLPVSFIWIEEENERWISLSSHPRNFLIEKTYLFKIEDNFLTLCLQNEKIWIVKRDEDFYKSKVIGKQERVENDPENNGLPI